MKKTWKAVSIKKKRKLVDYNTAQKIKKLGFDRSTCPYYDQKGVLHLVPIGFVASQPYNHNNKQSSYCSAPMWKGVADWLRRVHCVFVVIVPTEEGWYKVKLFFQNPYRIEDYGDYFEYDSALERGCKEAIKAIAEKQEINNQTNQ